MLARKTTVETVLLFALLALLSVDHDSTPTPNVRESAERTVVGQIVAVDLEKGTMIVGESVHSSNPKTSPKSREPLQLVFDADSKVFRGLKPSTFADLKAKDHAVVRYVVTPRGARVLSCRVAEVAKATVSATPVSGGGPSSSQ